MRVLLCTLPEKTIFMTLAPLAWALRAAGHDVRVAAQPDFAETIAQSGLQAVPLGRNTIVWRLSEVEPGDFEDDRLLCPPYDAAIDPSIEFEDIQKGFAGVVTAWHNLDNFGLFADTVRFCREWQPDLVLWEPLTYAGALGAEACGARHGRLLWSIDVFGAARSRFLQGAAERPGAIDPMRNWLEPFAEKYQCRFSETLVTGEFTIDQLPPSLSLRAPDLPYLGMQYVPYGGRSTVEPWVNRTTIRPRVAITLGLTATDRFAGYMASMQELLDALADLPIEVVATIADKERDKLTSVPANVTLVRFVPLQALVSTCSVIINHAGPGTYLTSALAGLPQLLIPYDFDEPELARRAAEHGGALTIPAEQATALQVREHLLRLLEEPEFRERAVAMQTELRAQPTPARLVPELEGIVAAGRGRLELAS